MRLKYLFSAEFQDGTSFIQNMEDRSLIDPDKRSSFYDLLHRVEEGSKLATFSLTDGRNSFTVDLQDGHFTINRVPFYLHEEREAWDFRLIFFRQHTHHFNQRVDYKDAHWQEVGKPKQVNHEIVYRMGWQATVDGKNVQRIIEFD